MWHSLQTVRREASSERARRGALSGLAWAATMVNIRHPEVVTALLSRLESTPAEHEAFANGVASSILMREETTPGAAFIRSFYEYEPPSSLSVASERWRKWVRDPAERATLTWQPTLRQSGTLGEIFRYRPKAEESGTP